MAIITVAAGYCFFGNGNSGSIITFVLVQTSSMSQIISIFRTSHKIEVQLLSDDRDLTNAEVIGEIER